MILSANLKFSDDQALTATAVSTNVIDLGAPGTVLGAPAALTRDVGKGTPVPIVIQLTADSGGTTPTINAALQMDTTDGFSSPTTVETTSTLSGGVAGDQLTLYFMPEKVTERYIRLNYTLSGTSPTYTVSAFFPLASQSADGLPGV